MNYKKKGKFEVSYSSLLFIRIPDVFFFNEIDRGENFYESEINTCNASNTPSSRSGSHSVRLIAAHCQVFLMCCLAKSLMTPLTQIKILQHFSIFFLDATFSI
jgi:hypothetical protein